MAPKYIIYTVVYIQDTRNIGSSASAQISELIPPCAAYHQNEAGIPSGRGQVNLALTEKSRSRTATLWWGAVRRGYGWGAGGGTYTREQQYYDRPEDTNIGRVISLGHRPSHRWHSHEWLAPAVAGSVDSSMYQQTSSSSYLHPIFSVWFSERFLSSSQH